VPTFDRFLVNSKVMNWVYFPNKILRQFTVKVLENRKIARKKAHAIATDGSDWRQKRYAKAFQILTTETADIQVVSGILETNNTNWLFESTTFTSELW
jgi:hypothetical protein